MVDDGGVVLVVCVASKTSIEYRIRKKPLLSKRLYLSGKRGSNPRPSAWKADALSTELFPQDKEVGSEGFEPPKVLPAELQSAPFGHSGNCPFSLLVLTVVSLRHCKDKHKIITCKQNRTFLLRKLHIHRLCCHEYPLRGLLLVAYCQ